jgi:alkylation response protein AidB-like acyl-CoA dehydrogenase
MNMQLMQLTEEQKLIRQTVRDFVDDLVIPFVRNNREREWLAPPEERMPVELLRAADKLGLRTLAVPEKYGGTQFENQAQTFAIIGEELARGDSLCGYAVPELEGVCPVERCARSTFRTSGSRVVRTRPSYWPTP